MQMIMIPVIGRKMIRKGYARSKHPHKAREYKGDTFGRIRVPGSS